MKLNIEFPMAVVESYHGAVNVNKTGEEYLSRLVLKYFKDQQIKAEIVKTDTVDPVPNTNDEMLRYELEVDMEPTAFFRPQWIVAELEKEGYEKGVTIKNHRGESLYADENTADIALRRNMQNK